MKALSTFYSRILPFLPGCSEPMVDQVLIDSAIEFCENSLVLRQNLDTFYTVVGLTSYDLDPPSSQHNISRVVSVAVNGTDLSGGLAEAIRNDLPTANSIPRGFYTDRTDNTFTLRLSPPPDKKYPVVVGVVLAPAITATQLDDDLYNTWIEPIVNGALSRAMMVPDQPFTNFARAQQLMEASAQKTVKARTEGNYGFVRGSMRVRARPFA